MYRQSIINNLIFASLFGLCLIGTIISAQDTYRNKSELTIKIVFQNGETQYVSDLKFEYEWLLQSQTKYINAPLHKTVSKNFHYKEVQGNVEIDHVIPIDSLKQILLFWTEIEKEDGKISQYEADSILFINRDWGSVKITKIDAASSFLQGISDENVEYPSLLRNINLNGITQIDHQKQDFSARLFGTYPYITNFDELIKSIIVLQD